MATHSSILAWGIPWTQDPGGLQFIKIKEQNMTKRLNHNQRTVLTQYVFNGKRKDYNNHEQNVIKGL